MRQETLKLIVESQMQDIETTLDKHSDSPEFETLRDEFQKLKEELTTGDWGRIGVMAGMLWYKLDTLINHLSSISSSIRNVERNTNRIK